MLAAADEPITEPQSDDLSKRPEGLRPTQPLALMMSTETRILGLTPRFPPLVEIREMESPRRVSESVLSFASFPCSYSSPHCFFLAAG